MYLSDLKIGRQKVIKELRALDPLSNRLSEMGCRRGMEVEIILINDGLCELRLGDTLVGVKLKDCRKILVE